jgi:hypothetical protein
MSTDQHMPPQSHDTRSCLYCCHELNQRVQVNNCSHASIALAAVHPAHATLPHFMMRLAGNSLSLLPHIASCCFASGHPEQACPRLGPTVAGAPPRVPLARRFRTAKPMYSSVRC